MEKDNHNGMKIKIKPIEVELDQAFAEVNEANSGSRKSGLNNKASYDASDVLLIGKSCKMMCSTGDSNNYIYFYNYIHPFHRISLLNLISENT
jgi:hypothetical protein